MRLLEGGGWACARTRIYAHPLPLLSSSPSTPSTPNFLPPPPPLKHTARKRVFSHIFLPHPPRLLLLLPPSRFAFFSHEQTNKQTNKQNTHFSCDMVLISSSGNPSPPPCPRVLPHGKKGTPQAPPEYSDSTQLPFALTSHPNPTTTTNSKHGVLFSPNKKKYEEENKKKKKKGENNNNNNNNNSILTHFTTRRKETKK